MASVLIVDDDSHIRELLRFYLELDGFRTIEAADGGEALKTLDAHKVDLVVLDIMLPNLDGWDLCREIRQYSAVPILMLTAKNETIHKVRGLRLGADDYLVKPFDPDELRARVHALLRRYRIATEQVITLGSLALDASTHTVLCNDVHVALAKKEFELLFKLASYPGTTLSRDQLIEDIWGYDFDGDERTVDVHVKRLRDKFPEETSSFRIVTVRGLGYRLEVIV
ncbi:response regulator transcription factor [Alicyclobacillus sp. ALC3]|uniref:response regulator transcription factor n=1 Tax=Alicyclobacillus sp. ALC3 TaxID=2796143 RepID=UPI0023796DBC|nr:response regulator transcription factor [Alicyclobacillus sp. ALC3]WDL98442.1 response regulator transcription factor [Alicyclobacillus sp. ALC3]